MEHLKKRQDFLNVRDGMNERTVGLVVQGRPQTDALGYWRVGFTASKKVGNAVERNRAKRRMREVARIVLGDIGKPNWDYVLIAKRHITKHRDFEKLQNDARRAVLAMHKRAKP